SNSSTTLVSSVNPATPGQSVTFTATVSALAPDSGTPTGTVTFSSGGTTLGTQTLDGQGVATLAVSSLPAGNSDVTATYSGDPDFAGSSGDLTQTVEPAESSTTLSADVNPSVYGQGVTFTATVAALQAGSGTPTGAVQLADGGAVIDTETLSGGTAT